MTDIKNQFACLANLPSMPVLLMDALQQMNGKQDITVLADKIGQDPSMAVRILRIANSPFYGMSREIGSLREAIVLLGLNRIRDMLIGVCFSKLLPTRHPDFNYQQFWHHSMAVAECTRQLANCTGISPDLAFTAGLLHDIGRLVIVVLFPAEFSQIIKVSDVPQLETERQLLGFDNVEIGGKAAQHWNLPEAIQAAIEQHQTPPAAGAAKSLSLLVYTANLLVVRAEQVDADQVDEQESIRTVLAVLNITLDQAAHCTGSGQQFADQVVTLF